MKTKILSSLLVLFATFGLSSCSDWFDVDPKTDVKAEDFFNSENGYQSALQGIYTKMAEEPTYGNNLTFGMLDQLALMYDFVPDGANSKEDIFVYDLTTSYGYNTKQRLAQTWSEAYNLIVNANNLDKWLDKKGTTVLDTLTRHTFKGEVRGLRAFIHFDLLRLWGPMLYDENDTTTYIPYRTIADNTKRPRLTAKATVEKILADLQEAETYLQADKGVSLNENDRRYRFNYYAVKALQARVYNYCGRKQEAFAAAKEVVDGCGLALQTNNTEDPAQFAECIFCIYLYNMPEEINQWFAEGPDFTTQYFTNAGTMQLYFENFTGTTNDVDIRFKSSGILGYSGKSYISRKYIKNDDCVIPLIRLPELYYIMCETADLDDAPQYVNAVKSKRGYTKSSLAQKFADEATRLHVLNYEYRTEFYAEGQYFHFLKRNAIESLNYYPTKTGTEEPFRMTKDIYVFPLPDNEIEYGWTTADDNTSAEQSDN